MINAKSLILIEQIFHFWMVTFLVVLFMVYTFRNLLGLLESAIMLQTSTLEKMFNGKTSKNRAIGIINFEKPFLNFIVDTIKTRLSESLSEPENYGDLVYKFKKLIGINDFSFQFRIFKTRYRRISYNLKVMR